ncbi:MAG TPA: redoxin domain-containing protein, partial [Candidatus Limnocylindria bacterium]|nr:redoxin domain-containing protein [Candidatus Limnocylindria bacterium]
GIRLAFAAAGALLLGAAEARAAEVGEKAPELNVGEWVQGSPAKIADGAGKTVWLVVLWGTFETDCISAMPALNTLYAKHKDAGLEIVGLSAEPADAVRTYLATHKVEYRMAVDPLGKVTSAYAGDVHSLPMSWLVDKTGTVVWRGAPANAGAIVEQVLGGKFDMKKASDAAAHQREMFIALSRGNWDEALAAAEKILEAEPADQTALIFANVSLQQLGNADTFKAFMKRHIERSKDDAKALGRIATQLATEGQLDWRDVNAALTAAKRAVEISKGEDAEAIEAYGRVLFTIGLTESAIEQQKKVVALEGADEGHKKILAYYEACIAARKKAVGPTPPPKKK